MVARQEEIKGREGVALYDNEDNLHSFVLALDAFFLTLYELQEMGCRVRFTRD